MIQFQFAEPQHIPQMTALWCEAFGDSPQYVQQFYAYWFPKAICLIALDGEKVVGMIHMLPVPVQKQGKVRSCRYLYAGAVTESYRSRGIFSGIMKRVTEICRSEHTDALVMPANERLFLYYEKCGFRKIPFFAETVFEKKTDSKPVSAEISELLPEDYERLRNRMLAKIPSAAQWSLAELDYAIREVRISGGFAKRIVSSEGECALLGYRKNDSAYLIEMTAPAAKQECFLQTAADLLPCRQLRCRVPFSGDLPLSYGMFLSQSGVLPDACYFPIDFI